MNEEVRNNVFFRSGQEFREAIGGFFEAKLPHMLPNLRQRINVNFELTSCSF